MGVVRVSGATRGRSSVAVECVSSSFHNMRWHHADHRGFLRRSERPLSPSAMRRRRKALPRALRGSMGDVGRHRRRAVISEKNASRKINSVHMRPAASVARAHHVRLAWCAVSSSHQRFLCSPRPGRRVSHHGASCRLSKEIAYGKQGGGRIKI